MSESSETHREREQRLVEEAVKIVRGETAMLATKEHLCALYATHEHEVVRICRDLHTLIGTILDRR